MKDPPASQDQLPRQAGHPSLGTTTPPQFLCGHAGPRRTTEAFLFWREWNCTGIILLFITHHNERWACSWFCSRSLTGKSSLGSRGLRSQTSLPYLVLLSLLWVHLAHLYLECHWWWGCHRWSLNRSSRHPHRILFLSRTLSPHTEGQEVIKTGTWSLSGSGVGKEKERKIISSCLI